MAELLSQETTYLDVNSLFSINVLPELLPDIQAINNSLYNLFRCPIGARPFRRLYGLNLEPMLQEPCDEETARVIKQYMLQAIRRWETRITVDYQRSTVVPLSTGAGYLVSLTYLVVATNLQGRATITLNKLS